MYALGSAGQSNIETRIDRHRHAVRDVNHTARECGQFATAERLRAHLDHLRSARRLPPVTVDRVKSA